MYKKSLRSILLIFILSGNSLFAQTFGGGFGLQFNPYKIYNKGHLYELADYVGRSSSSTYCKNWSYGKYFILMNDIRDSVRRVIGNNLLTNNLNCFDFQGNFDGQGHKITLALTPSNYKSNADAEFNCVHCGLFGYTSGIVEIKNVIVDGYIKGEVSPYGAAAGIVGRWYNQEYCDTAILNPKLTIRNCINMANISLIKDDGNVSVAGIVNTAASNSKNIIIENCINMGNIEGVALSTKQYSKAGGIISSNDNCAQNVFINRCMNTGYIKGDYAAGIASDFNYSDTCNNITNCINTGVIEGTIRSGIIIRK